MIYEEKPRNLLKDLCVLIGVCVVTHVVTKIIESARWNSGKCDTCGEHLFLHDITTKRKIYICPKCKSSKEFKI